MMALANNSLSERPPKMMNATHSRFFQ